MRRSLSATSGPSLVRFHHGRAAAANARSCCKGVELDILMGHYDQVVMKSAMLSFSQLTLVQSPDLGGRSSSFCNFAETSISLQIVSAHRKHLDGGAAVSCDMLSFKITRSWFQGRGRGGRRISGRGWRPRQPGAAIGMGWGGEVGQTSSTQFLGAQLPPGTISGVQPTPYPLGFGQNMAQGYGQVGIVERPSVLRLKVHQFFAWK